MNPPAPVPKMSRDKPRFFERLMPWMGSLIIVMGASQAGLTLSRSAKIDMQALGTGLLICSGGLGLIARRVKFSPALFLYVGGALITAWAIVQAVHR